MYWDFEDGAGQVAADMSGYGNDGQLGSTTGADTSDPCWIDPNQNVRLRIIFQRISGSGISLALKFDKQLNYSAFFGNV